MKKHTVIGGKDRCDYRAMSTSQLIEEANYAIGVEWRELATALAERLEKKEREKVWAQCPDCMDKTEA